MTIIDEIRKALPSQCVNAAHGKKTCGGKGCRAVFSKAFDPSLLVDVDCLPFPAGKRCDHLFFGRNNVDGKIWIVAIELKRGVPDMTEVAKQLQGCARFAERLVDRWRNTPFDFYPVLVHGRRFKKTETLPKKRVMAQVSFRGVKADIIAKSNALTLPRRGPA